MPDDHESQQTRNVPVGALRFGYGPCQFGAAESDGTVPVSLVARSAEPINHWYWGAIVHDLAGMQRHKDRITLDYAHYDQEVLGYADQFSVTPEGLKVCGKLTPFGENDRASEVAYKAKAGVPYESSIFFADPVIEDVPAGKSTAVNGKQFAGPITVVRQCDLRGIAICPYGADKNTPVQFASGDQIQVQVIQHKENAMADEQQPAEDVVLEDATPEVVAEPVEEPAAVETPAVEPVAEVVEPVAVEQSAKTGADFLSAFGPQGAVWFVEGKTWDECHKLHSDALQAKIAELEAKLAGVQFGQPDPVSFSPAEDDPEARKRTAMSSRLGDNVARFACGIKLPENSNN